MRVRALLPFAVVVGACLAASSCGGKDGPDPRKIVLSYSNTSRPYMPAPEEVVKQIASDLEEAGFTVDLRKHDWNPYLDLTKRGDHQLALFGWSADIPDVDNFLYVLLDKENARPGGAQNISFYTDEAVHQLLEKARYTYDAEARGVLYRSAQERILADVPMVPLAFSDRVLAHAKGVGPIALELITHPVLARLTEPRDGRVVYGRGGDAKSLDPARITDGESSLVTEQLFDTLVRYKPGGVEVEPGLALSWTHDEERRLWHFRLREGVTFHDGTPCDAAAVVNAFERQRDPRHPQHQPNMDYWGDLLGYVAQVEVGTDALDVVFRLDRPAPSFFVPTLAVFTFGIPSPTALAQQGAEFGRRPVGTGPFRFVSWETKSEIVLQRHDGWWGGRPGVKDLVFRVIPDANARTQVLRAKQAQIIDNVGLSTLPQLEADPDVVVIKQPGMHLAYLSMNVKKPPFDDLRVREAVALALDKRRIVQAGWEGRAQPAVTPVPPNLPANAQGLVDRVRDLARARRLLDEALGPVTR